MRKEEIITQCLVNSNLVRDEKQAEEIVLQCFQKCFPKESFLKWNTKLGDRLAEDIIKSFGRASRIDVEQFIRDLWE